jgi:anthranilate phosphoribosyltransferase
MREYLERLVAGDDLGFDGAHAAMGIIMRGEANPSEVAGFLVGLRVHGETPAEIAGCVQALREHVVPVTPVRDDLTDIVGTGGDGAHTFNISTAAALVVAACGAGVAKHGNRALTSLAGSADVLEALGVAIDLGPDAVATLVDEVGFGFMFAPNHHPAMRFAGPVRRELGIRTVMNLLGPLTNPARVPTQVIGVPRPELVEVFAAVAAELGTTRTVVVHGAGGIDELSPAGPSTMAMVADGAIRVETILPRELGFEPSAPDDLRGGDAAENAATIRALFGGARGPKRDAVILNASAGLVACGRVRSLAAGVDEAAAAIDDRRASELLERLVRRSRELADTGAA